MKTKTGSGKKILVYSLGLALWFLGHRLMTAATTSSPNRDRKDRERQIP